MHYSRNLVVRTSCVILGLFWTAARPAIAATTESAPATAAAPATQPTTEAVLAPATLLRHGWLLQDAASVTGDGDVVSTPAFDTRGWHAAVVPGTVLTSLVADGTYPNPLFGLNNRSIPDTLCRTQWWYRTSFNVPADFAGRHVWLNFDGVNYTAEVWLNGFPVGVVRGAFSRGNFDVSNVVQPGKTSVLAVLICPQPHPGSAHEKTQATGTGPNGGMTAVDGPTFLSSIGWDWVPTIHDRQSGLWQDVSLSATGPVLVENPYVRTALPLPRTDSADLTVQATVRSVSNRPQSGTITGSIGDEVQFTRHITVAPHQSKTISFDPASDPALHLNAPRLWWPNGYGAQNLYKLHLLFTADSIPAPPTTRPANPADDGETNMKQLRHFDESYAGGDSSAVDSNFGVRTITYSIPQTPNLALCVNGVPVIAKGGDWGLDDALKRVDPQRLDAQVRMHQQANYTIIRNWVGQSTSEAFYDACDKYGILIWDELFQPNPSDGPNPLDSNLYLDNVKEKLLRYRNHPSIALWCARNEGDPPALIGQGIQSLINRYDPVRLYQASSTRGRGVNSGGPYHWRTPKEYYSFHEAFKTELGSMSIPTLEAVQAMLPRGSWDVVDDAWAEHDFCGGAQEGDIYPHVIAQRYGAFSGLADFVRKGQLANYEAYRAMYEGRFAQLFNPVTGVITWMSHPAQPSFVWQLYTYDLEPNASLFGARKACEPVHVQMNQTDWHLLVVNDKPTPLNHLTATARIYDLDGTLRQTITRAVDAAASAATDAGELTFDPGLSAVHFVELELRDDTQVLSDNFYWRGTDDDDLKALDSIPTVPVKIDATRQDAGATCRLSVKLTNPTPHVAVMAHLQLRQSHTGRRVLPVFYSENYVSLVPGEQRSLTIECPVKALGGETPQLAVDGWNVGVDPTSSGESVGIIENAHADARSLPPTGGPADSESAIRINCGGPRTTPVQFGKPIEGPGIFERDIYAGYTGHPQSSADLIDVTAPQAAPMAVYQSARLGESKYQIPVNPRLTYTLRLHFADTQSDAGQRRFDVDLDRQPLLHEFDIAAEVGRGRACVKTFDGIKPPPDGRITLDFKRGTAGEPLVCGIELVPTSAGTP